MIGWARPVSIRTRLTLWYSGVLLCIVLLTSVLGYSALRWSLMQDLDASLLTVADVLRDTSLATEGPRAEVEVQSLLRDLLGPAFDDEFFRLLDTDGRPESWPSRRYGPTLPLTSEGRANAVRGLKTFETVRIAAPYDVRLLTLPLIKDGLSPASPRSGCRFIAWTLPCAAIATR